MMISLKLSQSKKRYKPRDPNYNNYYYHKKVAPVECTICGRSVVDRALYNHKKTANCKLVKHVKDIAQTEYNQLKLIQDIMASLLMI